MSEIVFCNSNLLTQVSNLLYVDGYIYASNFGTPTGSIVKIDLQGNATSLYVSNGILFTGMTYYNNNLYLTDDNSHIYKIDTNGNNFTEWLDFSQTYNQGLGITYYDGYLYTCNKPTVGTPKSTVFKVNVNTKDYSNFIVSTSNSINFYYITTDDNGFFYITCDTNVLKFNLNGELLGTFITGDYNNILFFNNYFYFTSRSVNQISQYNNNGSLITNNFATGGLTYVGGGMVFDDNYIFYVANGEGSGNVTINSLTIFPNPTKGSYSPKTLYINNPGSITYTNSTLYSETGYTYVLVDSNGNYVSDELTTTSNPTTLTFTNVILDNLGINNLIIYYVDFNTEISNISINVLAQDEELGMVTTNPSPLLQNNAGTLTYTNVTITPIVNNSYVLKNIYGSYVSNILYVTTTGLSSFNFLNVIIPFGGINNLTIYNITTRKTIVYNIEIGVSTVCFKEGTKILCCINKKEVYVPIEKIKEDDFVKVYDGKYSYKKAKFIIKSQLMNSPSTTINKLYKLSKDKYHSLIDDLYVTGGHALLHDSLSEDELEKMEALANHYNNYNVVVENENLTDQERESMSQLIKYYRDYKITMFNKYKLIAYYNLNFEEVNDNALFNIYHLVIENDNKYGSYGVFANGILAETTDEAGLIRFPGYEKINCKIVIPKVAQTILIKLASKLHKQIIKETDKFLEEEETKETRVRRTLKRNKVTNKNITLRK